MDLTSVSGKAVSDAIATDEKVRAQIVIDRVVED
jgi:hypothetical protein